MFSRGRSHMVYFCAFACSEIFQTTARKSGVGHGQFDAGVSGLIFRLSPHCSKMSLFWTAMSLWNVVNKCLFHRQLLPVCDLESNINDQTRVPKYFRQSIVDMVDHSRKTRFINEFAETFHSRSPTCLWASQTGLLPFSLTDQSGF